MMIILTLVWLAAREYYAGGVPFVKGQRDIVVTPYEGHIDSFPKLVDVCTGLRYEVVDTAGKVVVSELIFYPVLFIATFSSGLFLLRVIGDLISYPGQLRRIKKLFRPLDEIAQKAEEIYRLDLSEDKYHLIEEKITSLEPT